MGKSTREGVRGGRAAFSWEEVKSDKQRDHYLGHSIMAPIQRLGQRNDVLWYSRDKQNSGENNEEEATNDEERHRRKKAEERMKIKEAEERALAEALGVPYVPKNTVFEDRDSRSPSINRSRSRSPGTSRRDRERRPTRDHGRRPRRDDDSMRDSHRVSRRGEEERTSRRDEQHREHKHRHHHRHHQSPDDDSSETRHRHRRTHHAHHNHHRHRDEEDRQPTINQSEDNIHPSRRALVRD